ncbi:hypothetical protein PIIN_09962 [Serendipita indica DSM 11827]|uniref:Uncharacterized protein n=1 Tax=Serendipita indica (strain DSM 11827) TaxID=1109443 RepID=G4TXC3_SERID|nr:hypothetical protein PIIN_09962 [Serendipita indica DSM 11827]
MTGYAYPPCLVSSSYIQITVLHQIGYASQPDAPQPTQWPTEPGLRKPMARRPDQCRNRKKIHKQDVRNSSHIIFGSFGMAHWIRNKLRPHLRDIRAISGTYIDQLMACEYWEAKAKTLGGAEATPRATADPSEVIVDRAVRTCEVRVESLPMSRHEANVRVAVGKGWNKDKAMGKRRRSSMCYYLSNKGRYNRGSNEGSNEGVISRMRGVSGAEMRVSRRDISSGKDRRQLRVTVITRGCPTLHSHHPSAGEFRGFKTVYWRISAARALISLKPASPTVDGQT